MNADILIIAEAGVNHNGDMEKARRLVEIAARAGADVVKFQTFKAERLVTVSADKAAYQKETTGASESQFEMIRKLELDMDSHRMLQDHCARHGIEFLSTPFDSQSLDDLIELGMETIKIPSGEITNLPFLRHAGAKGKRVLLSTGMSSMEEVHAAVDVLVEAGMPREMITVLHCNTQYPTPFEDANLRAMETLGKELPGLGVGYSDHTPGIEAPLAAAALGACVIEKHFTLDKSLPGPDHKASLDPEELKTMVTGIRNVQKALGTGDKVPSASEQDNIAIARKFLVASRPIVAGESFSPENVSAKRTGRIGVSPMQWDAVMTMKAERDYAPDEMLELGI